MSRSAWALGDALAKYGKPEIFNTDQGSQFTSASFTAALSAAGIQISPWTGADAGWTTSSSSASGDRSSTRISI
jgi:transposase InsO family protein